MPTVLKYHAEQQMQKRLRLSPEDLLGIIEADLVVPLGTETGTNRLHKLFYSGPDADWCIAIHDVNTDEIVTVLPYHYHNRWRISEESLELARRIADAGRTMYRLSPPRARTPMLLRISCRVRTKKKTLEDIGLGDIALELFGARVNVHQAVKTKLFKGFVSHQIKDRVDTAKIPVTIYVKAGKSGMRLAINYLTLFPGGRTKDP